MASRREVLAGCVAVAAAGLSLRTEHDEFWGTCDTCGDQVALITVDLEEETSRWNNGWEHWRPKADPITGEAIRRRGCAKHLPNARRYYENGRVVWDG